MNILQDLSVAAPLWILAGGAALVLLLTVASGHRQPTPPTSHHLVLITLAALGVSGAILATRSGAGSAFGGALLVDGLGILFGTVALTGGLCATLFAAGYLREHELSSGEFFALILLSSVGMLTLTMAGDLITAFIGLETMSLAVYVLAGFVRVSPQSQEAALKYFIYGAFASGFFLFGTALLYGEVGHLTGKPSVHFAALALAVSAGAISKLGWIGVGLVLSGFAFKVAAVPFHMWAPDVYEGAPTAATGFMAVGVKTAAFAALARFAVAVFAHGKMTATGVGLFEVLAILTMAVGNFLALRQTKIKRMLAYSSIAHAGYLLVGVVALCAQSRSGALEAMVYYLLGYTGMTLGAFGVVAAFERREIQGQNLAIERLTGIGRRYPALGLVMTVFMLSLAGVPPTAGFFGKVVLFSAALTAGRVPLVIVAVLLSAVGAYYYLRVIVVMYMFEAPESTKRVASAWQAAGLWACAALVIGIGLLPGGCLTYARDLLASWLGT